MRGLAIAASLIAISAGFAIAGDKKMNTSAHQYAGLWVTADGHIRHELLPNGRYVEARGTREKAYQGRYLVTGNHIDYWDDTGFTADGDFVDDVLHHAGMILHRRR
ncbi:Atu4866 domain-containing protein [Mesorhizobium comanense]|uniref:Atu4866 domain-containing protein n=1 Tax=Mesorhizobium comanense TaxID=2502215 RepID=UPI0010F9052C|nr:Atu4866 domain-containing protein [Mesorhizobium comanense]